MIVAFRVDAGTHIGTGHVMRCRVLANALRQHGVEVLFIARKMPGDMIQSLRQEALQVVELPGNVTASGNAESDPWLTVPPNVDAQQTLQVLQPLNVDLLVIDSYGIDAAWESIVSPHVGYLMVIDDTANRYHQCDFLLDQNLKDGFETAYAELVSPTSVQLLGPQYALVRPEFSNLRQVSLDRRTEGKIERLLISMGGSDPEDEVSRVVKSIKHRSRCWKHIDVVVGAAYGPIESLKGLLQGMPAELHIQTSDMAQLMQMADIAVTAGGSTSWEKCTLGLPSVVAVLAENQAPIGAALHACGAQITVEPGTYGGSIPYADVLNGLTADDLQSISQSARHVCDGKGANRVSAFLLQECRK